MTGGIVVVLGATGRNFAAGMSGGIAFVFDDTSAFRTRNASPAVEIAAIANVDDRNTLRRLIEQHARFTGSRRAKHALSHWEETVSHFVRVMPVEYRRALDDAANRAGKRDVGEAPRYG